MKYLSVLTCGLFIALPAIAQEGTFKLNMPSLADTKQQSNTKNSQNDSLPPIRLKMPKPEPVAVKKDAPKKAAPHKTKATPEPKVKKESTPKPTTKEASQQKEVAQKPTANKAAQAKKASKPEKPTAEKVTKKSKAAPKTQPKADAQEPAATKEEPKAQPKPKPEQKAVPKVSPKAEAKPVKVEKSPKPKKAEKTPAKAAKKDISENTKTDKAPEKVVKEEAKPAAAKKETDTVKSIATPTVSDDKSGQVKTSASQSDKVDNSLPKLLMFASFDSNSVMLKPDDRKQLDVVAKKYKEDPNAQFEVRAFAILQMGIDGRRPALARAMAVRNYLIAAGINGKNIATYVSSITIESENENTLRVNLLRTR